MHVASMGGTPKFNVPSKGQQSEMFESFSWMFAYPVCNCTQPCLTSAKLMGLTMSLHHSPQIEQRPILCGHFPERTIANLLTASQISLFFWAEG